MSIIFLLVVIMMEVTVDHQTSQIGQNVPIIQDLLEMEYVMIISKPNLNAIMMPQIVVLSQKLLVMDHVKIISKTNLNAIMMEETVVIRP